MTRKVELQIEDDFPILVLPIGDFGNITGYHETTGEEDKVRNFQVSSQVAIVHFLYKDSEYKEFYRVGKWEDGTNGIPRFHVHDFLNVNESVFVERHELPIHLQFLSDIREQITELPHITIDSDHHICFTWDGARGSISVWFPKNGLIGYSAIVKDDVGATYNDHDEYAPIDGIPNVLMMLLKGLLYDQFN